MAFIPQHKVSKIWLGINKYCEKVECLAECKKDCNLDKAKNYLQFENKANKYSVGKPLNLIGDEGKLFIYESGNIEADKKNIKTKTSIINNKLTIPQHFDAIVSAENGSTLIGKFEKESDAKIATENYTGYWNDKAYLKKIPKTELKVYDSFEKFKKIMEYQKKKRNPNETEIKLTI